jgi:hypothetical protein
MRSPYLLETEETAKLFGLTKVSDDGTTALMAKFLLLVSFGLVGRPIFYLFLGLTIVGDDTGDFPLSFLSV